MKELRTPHDKHLALGAFFAFDPKRPAILLISGDKHGQRDRFVGIRKLSLSELIWFSPT
jgi:hypothetical protein